MRDANIRIGPYEPGQLSDVTRLLQTNLWRHPSLDESYFKWKYHNNPYASGPLGVVATRNAKVVGFRGYMALNWFVGDERKSTTFLVPGDTVVDPEHQRRGLSVAMGKLASEHFATKASFFLNMTAGRNAVPGYLRLGFFSLQNKTHLAKRCLAADLRAHCRFALIKEHRHRTMPLTELGIRFGQFGDILVSGHPCPNEMSLMASSDAGPPARITLLQDREFFRWRYANPSARYVFYFARREQEMSAFIVMKLSEDKRSGSIVDFGGKDEAEIAKILSHITDSGDFQDTRVLNVGLENSFLKLLKAQGFSSRPLRRMLKRAILGEAPILVRPVKQPCLEEDWFISGLDTRLATNWRIKPICSDSA